MDMGMHSPSLNVQMVMLLCSSKHKTLVSSWLKKGLLPHCLTFSENQRKILEKEGVGTREAIIPFSKTSGNSGTLCLSNCIWVSKTQSSSSLQSWGGGTRESMGGSRVGCRIFKALRGGLLKITESRGITADPGLVQCFRCSSTVRASTSHSYFFCLLNCCGFWILTEKD